jgi:hypothetical protein
MGRRETRCRVGGQRFDVASGRAASSSFDYATLTGEPPTGAARNLGQLRARCLEPVGRRALAVVVLSRAEGFDISAAVFHRTARVSVDDNEPDCAWTQMAHTVGERTQAAQARDARAHRPIQGEHEGELSTTRAASALRSLFGEDLSPRHCPCRHPRAVRVVSA